MYYGTNLVFDFSQTWETTFRIHPPLLISFWYFKLYTRKSFSGEYQRGRTLQLTYMAINSQINIQQSNDGWKRVKRILPCSSLVCSPDPEPVAHFTCCLRVSGGDAYVVGVSAGIQKRCSGNRVRSYSSCPTSKTFSLESENEASGELNFTFLN